MPHRRDEIRKLLVDELKGKTLANDNVFNWRIRPIQNEKYFPSISIYIPEETVIEISGACDLIHRKAQVYILVNTAVSNNDEDLSDEISKQIESIVNALNNRDFEFKYNKMEIFSENLSTKMLIISSLNYECSYFTSESLEINADNFEHLSIEVLHG